MSNKVKTDEILGVINFARHSPSSHNTQPWTIRLNDKGFTLGYRPQRQLKVGDPDKRELFISLGCFIESVLRVSGEVGLAANYKFVGDAADLVAVFDFKPGISANQARRSVWSHLIKNRRSDRRLYQDRKIPEKVIKNLSKINVSGALPVIVNNRESINFLSKKTGEATLELMTGQSFRDELSSWVRNNWTKKPDGMPAYTQGMPGPISLIAKIVIRKTKSVAKDQAKKDAKRVANSAAVILVSTKDESAEQLINAGRVYQSVCLESLKEGIKSSGISAALIDKKTNQEIVEKLGLTSNPVALIRLGYTKGTVRPSPRLRTEDIIS